MHRGLDEVAAWIELHKFLKLSDNVTRFVNGDVHFRAKLSFIFGDYVTVEEMAEVHFCSDSESLICVSLIGAEKAQAARLPMRFYAGKHWMKCHRHGFLIIHDSTTNLGDVLLYISHS